MDSYSVANGHPITFTVTFIGIFLVREVTLLKHPFADRMGSKKGECFMLMNVLSSRISNNCVAFLAAMRTLHFFLRETFFLLLKSRSVYSIKGARTYATRKHCTKFVLLRREFGRI